MDDGNNTDSNDGIIENSVQNPVGGKPFAY